MFLLILFFFTLSDFEGEGYESGAESGPWQFTVNSPAQNKNERKEKEKDENISKEKENEWTYPRMTMEKSTPPLRKIMDKTHQRPEASDDNHQIRVEDAVQVCFLYI